MEMELNGQGLLLVLFAAVPVVAVVCFVMLRKRGMIEHEADPELPKVVDRNVECCGEHEVCEAETLLTLTEDIIYYADEELDAYKGVASDAYADEQIEEFREVLLTLQPHEVSGWLKSIGLRGIELPDIIREESLMVVDDFRRARREHKTAAN